MFLLWRFNLCCGCLLAVDQTFGHLYGARLFKCQYRPLIVVVMLCKVQVEVRLYGRATVCGVRLNGDRSFSIMAFPKMRGGL